MAEALAAIEAEQTVVVPPLAALQVASPSRKRRWPLVAAAVAGLLLLATVAAGVVITLQTKNGTITVTVTEPDVKVFIDGKERLVIDSTKVGRP